MGNSALRCAGRICEDDKNTKPRKIKQRGEQGNSSSSKKGLLSPSSSADSRPSSPPEKPPRRRKKSIRPSMELLPPANDGVMRVKLVISTEQMADMLSSECGKADFLDNLLTSLLKQHKISPDSLNKEAALASSQQQQQQQQQLFKQSA